MTKKTKDAQVFQVDAVKSDGSTVPATITVGEWSPEPIVLPGLNPADVTDALASVDSSALLSALCAVHGVDPVVIAVEAMRGDPNYGLTAASWLALKSGDE